MSASQIRRQLESKRKQRIDAEKQAARHRKKEADKRAAATKASSAAGKTKNATTMKSKAREAARRETEANSAGAEYAKAQEKAAKYGEEEAKLAKAEESERQADERRRERERLAAERHAATELAHVGRRVDAAESRVAEWQRELRPPKVEQLRILLLAASADGGLRVNREQARIRLAVERAVHRDYVELDVRPSATTADLLDGIGRFRPHVVHFSGHSSGDVIVFEEDVDLQPSDDVVAAEAFAAAIAATDEPPLLVVLNSCNSADQLRGIVDRVAPLAIGMSDTIDDGEAIVYSTQFYASVASGQSVLAAHLSGQAALQLAGMPGHDLPQLVHAGGVDPGETFLVSQPTA